MKNIYLIFGFIYLFLLSFAFAACSPDEDELIPESCFDGVLNQNETQIDCGGVCDPCDPCTNGVLDTNEQWVDCGGNCPPCEPCSNGQQDADQGETGIDCGGPCGPCAELCDDGLLNGNEERIDCGGECDPCPSCEDEMMNGQEIGVDCGGPECEDCPETAGNCTNGEQDGDEFGVDCGGSACVPCEYYFTFSVSGASGSLNGSYDAPTFTSALEGPGLVMTGIGLNDAVVTITMPPPLAGWENAAGYNTVFNEGTADDVGRVMTLTAPGSGIVYTTDDPNGSATLTITEIRGIEPMYIKGTFTGGALVEDVTGAPQTISIGSGTFYMPIPN